MSCDRLSRRLLNAREIVVLSSLTANTLSTRSFPSVTLIGAINVNHEHHEDICITAQLKVSREQVVARGVIQESYQLRLMIERECLMS